MLLYELHYEDNNEVFYKYRPEGGEEYGVVKINKNNSECSVINLAPSDTHKIYAIKMMSRMRNFVKEKKFLEKGIVAWY